MDSSSNPNLNINDKHRNTTTNAAGVAEEEEERREEQLQLSTEEKEENNNNNEEEEEEEEEEESESNNESNNKNNNNNNNEEDEDDEEEEEEEEEDVIPFNSDEEAIAARTVALKLYNSQQYEEALDMQYRIVRHFEKKYGATSHICGTYFLDYGLSQLRIIQSKCSVEDALQPLDQEALKTCFINLDVARVCFQKEEEIKGEENIEVQLQLAEVHNAIAQLHVEREDFDGALKEYESELLTYRFIQEQYKEQQKENENKEEKEKENKIQLPYGRIAAVLYGIADCYMKEGDFAEAERRFTSALEEIATFPTGIISKEIISELEELREDAREMKGGKFKEIQESIQEQFAVQEAERLPTAQEFYGDFPNNNNENENNNNNETMRQQHPYVSQLPCENEYSALSMPQSLSHPIQWNEHSNSMSLSLFPPQINNNNNNNNSGRSPEASNSEIQNQNNSQSQSQTVHHVVARRKPKQHHLSQNQQNSQQQQQEIKGSGVNNNSSESDVKRLRTESCN